MLNSSKDLLKRIELLFTVYKFVYRISNDIFVTESSQMGTILVREIKITLPLHRKKSITIFNKVSDKNKLLKDKWIKLKLRSNIMN